MKTDIAITAQDRNRLQRLFVDRNTPSKVVWRAQIVLATADGESVKSICRLTGKSKPCVWRWQARFAEEGVEGLLRDKTRPPGRKPLSDAIKAKVLTKTATETPPNATVVLSVDDPRRLLPLHHRLEALHHHEDRGCDRHARACPAGVKAGAGKPRAQAPAAVG